MIPDAYGRMSIDDRSCYDGLAWTVLTNFAHAAFSTEQPGVSFLPNLLTYQSEKGVKSLSFVSSAMTAQLEVWNHRSCEHDAKKLEMVTGHELVAKDDKGGQAGRRKCGERRSEGERN